MGFFKLVWVWGGVGGFWIGFYVLYVSVGGGMGVVQYIPSYRKILLQIYDTHSSIALFAFFLASKLQTPPFTP